MLTELQNRGVQDILIAAVDGLKGFPEAIETVFPKTEIQLCIVHVIRNSLRFVLWKEPKKVAAGLQTIYTAATREAAEQALDAFEESWGDDYPIVVKSWCVSWANLSTFFAYPAEMRKLIYTTNAIESINAQLRKLIPIQPGNRNIGIASTRGSVQAQVESRGCANSARCTRTPSTGEYGIGDADSHSAKRCTERVCDGSKKWTPASDLQSPNVSGHELVMMHVHYAARQQPTPSSVTNRPRT